MQRPIERKECFGASAHGMEIGQLEGQELRFGAGSDPLQFLQDRLGPFSRASGEKDLGAQPRELERRHATYAGIGAGNENYAPG
jgi:hypothetical protein